MESGDGVGPRISESYPSGYCAACRAAFVVISPFGRPCLVEIFSLPVSVSKQRRAVTKKTPSFVKNLGMRGVECRATIASNLSMEQHGS
jgi:hypothetical protein